MLKLKELRIKYGKTQNDVAEAMHISRVNYCNYENGKRDPSTDTIKLLAAYFNVSADELLGIDCVGTPDNETQLLSVYRALNDRGKQLVEDYAEMLVARPAYREEESAESAM